MPALPCLCDALMSDDQDGVEIANPEQFTWEPWVSTEDRLEDGRAKHLEGLQTHDIPLLLDAHSHWFPENVEQKIWRYFDRHYWKVTYRFPGEERLAWMRRNGVRRFAALNYAHRPAMAAWLNEWSANFAQTVPEAIPCGTFFTEPEAAMDVRRCIEEYGFRGFKLHLRVSDMDPTHPLLEPAFEQIAHAGLPVILHAGSGPERGRFTSPEYIRMLVERHPELKVVVAHMGANEYEEYLTLAERHEHLYLDTTMVFVGFLALNRFPKGHLERLEVVANKVLFGSDFPTIPYPLTHAVQSILDLPLSGQAKRRILGENALGLFGLEESPGQTPTGKVGRRS